MAADYCVLVAEPTAFGFHNFQMVYELAALLGKPCGVAINKQELPYGPLEDFCRERGVPILARLPYDPQVAAWAAAGEIAARKSSRWNGVFRDLLDTIGGTP